MTHFKSYQQSDKSNLIYFFRIKTYTKPLYHGLLKIINNI